MNTRQIKGFYKLAETLNFSRAAEQMYMSQSAFSRMIESLETELGAKLIERGRTRPKLTEVGEAILPNIRRILDECGRISDTVHRLGKSSVELTVGILEEGLQGRRAELLRGFSGQNPSVDINFLELSESDAFEAVLERRVDCALLAHFPEALRASMSGEIMGSVPKCVVMNRIHPLSGRDTIAVAELRDEGFVVIDESRSRYGYFDTIGLCTKNGFMPRIVKKTSSLSTAMSEIEMNAGVMILSADLKFTASDDVIFIPLEGEADCRLWCIHTADGGSWAMQQFSEYIRQNELQEE